MSSVPAVQHASRNHGVQITKRTPSKPRWRSVDQQQSITEFAHNCKPVRIGQGKVLVGELLDDAARLGQLGSVEASDRQARQGIDEGQELNRPVPIIAAEEPPMPSATTSEEVSMAVVPRKTAEQRVEAIGPIQEGDEG